MSSKRYTPSRIYWGAKRRVCSRLFIDLNNSIDQTVLILGSGRSGTTWLAQLVNFDNAYRYIFEPFNPLRMQAWKGLRSRLYAPADFADAGAISATESILRGDVRSAWADVYNRRFFCGPRLVKEIAANNMIELIRSRFGGMKVIYIIRHPYSVAASRLRLGWDQESDATVRTDLDVFRSQPALMQRFPEPCRRLLSTDSTGFVREVLFWLGENYIPWQAGKQDEGIHVLSYEQLMIEPEPVVSGLFAFIGREYDRRLWRAFERMSPTTGREGEPEVQRKELLNGWKKRVTAEERETAERIMDAFGADEIFRDPRWAHVYAE